MLESEMTMIMAIDYLTVVLKEHRQWSECYKIKRKRTNQKCEIVKESKKPVLKNSLLELLWLQQLHQAEHNKKKNDLLLLHQLWSLSTLLYQNSVIKKKNELPLQSLSLPSAMSPSFHTIKIKRKNHSWVIWVTVRQQTVWDKKKL